MTTTASAHSQTWKWYVCGMLLLANMLNYMDRQTLSLVVTDIRTEFEQRGTVFTNEDYGNLELGFGLAFACGAIVTGFVVDRANLRWMYPAMLLGWSAAGFVTAWADSYRSLLVCRIVLGFFEASQMPLALTISQRILSRQDRSMGNSILQSGLALGAILTPLIIQAMIADDPESARGSIRTMADALNSLGIHWTTLGTWRAPFQVIGALGCLWMVPWLFLVRSDDLRRQDPGALVNNIPNEVLPTTKPFAPVTPRLSFATLSLRFAALAVVAVAINLCWHFFRAWLPKFLREFHHYDRTTVNYFTAIYYVATDIGCLSAGFVTKRLIVSGWRVHSARLMVFFACSLLTALSMMAAWLPAGWPLLGVLLVIGFGALGLYPNYYSFSQELTTRHQGKVSGSLVCITWIFSAAMHPVIGHRIDETQSYAEVIFLVGLAPMVGLIAMLLLWDWRNLRPAQNGHNELPLRQGKDVE